jgi:hypothetical protein
MKFKEKNFVRITCNKKDLLEIGVNKSDVKKIVDKLGYIFMVWGKDRDKYNVKICGVSNNGYNYAFEEWMLTKYS